MMESRFSGVNQTDGFGETLAEFRGIQKPLEDSLVCIMTGLA
jgi:hypothetical protein